MIKDVIKQETRGQKRVHGLTKHRFFPRWNNIMSRCYNPKHDKYSYYGGRGIKVSDEFHDPAIFIAYLEALPGYGIDGNTTIDRIENNGHYEKGNLRWANRKAQQENTRLYQKSKSGVKGVSYNSRRNYWAASLYFNNKQIHIGCSPTKEGALQKRNDYIIKNNLPHKIQKL